LAASILAVLAAACATTDAPSEVGRDQGRSPTRGQPTGAYEVREASEARDTDELQISLERGVISQEAAQDAVARRLPDLTRCYTRAGAAMGFAGGRVSLRFLVDGRGAITDVRVTESRLGNFEVERCLIEVGRTVIFPRPRGNASATVDYSLEFRSTGDLAVTDLAPQVVEPRLPTLYARLGGCPGLGPEEVTATLYVDTAGAVRSAGLASEEAVAAEAADCVATALRRWTVRLTEVRAGVGRVTLPLRRADMVSRRETPAQARYSRTPTTRGRRRPAR
jgi:hypothetical protein